MTRSRKQIAKIPAARREQAEQAVARLGVVGAIEAGWPVEDVQKAVQRIAYAHGEKDDDPPAKPSMCRACGHPHGDGTIHARLSAAEVAAAETTAKYAHPHRQYRHHGGGAA